MKKQVWLVLTVFILLAYGIGCSVKPTLSAETQAKVDEYAKTVTARAAEASAPQATVDVLAAQATQNLEMVQATRAVQTQSVDLNAQATATAAAPIRAELPLYDINPNEGHPGWIHQPITMSVDGYHQFGFNTDYPTITARDFVIVSDIQWESRYGTSGCGFILRSNGDQRSLNQYVVVATRLGYGHIFFAALVDGKPANFKDLYANNADPFFDWQNQATNRLAIVGRANLLTIYTNFSKVGEIDVSQPPANTPNLPPKPERPKDETPEKLAAYEKQIEAYNKAVKSLQERYQDIKTAYSQVNTLFPEGFLGMAVASESGKTVCKFSNTWLWILDP